MSADNGGQALRVPVHERESGTLGREGTGNSQADAARGAGDHGRRAFQVVTDHDLDGGEEGNADGAQEAVGLARAIAHRAVVVRHDAA